MTSIQLDGPQTQRAEAKQIVSQLHELGSLTSQQVDTWIEANFPNATAKQKAFFEAIGRSILVLHRLYRQGNG